jgi:flagellar biosynthesis/type III secretory pathway M-ring protein FliF/YscJ
MSLAIAVIASVAIIMIGLIFMQKNHYEFLKAQKSHIELSKISHDLETKLREFDEYKKRVDGLTVKAGFKL